MVLNRDRLSAFIRSVLKNKIRCARNRARSHVDSFRKFRNDFRYSCGFGPFWKGEVICRFDL